jgi:hypothetical protein
MAQFDWQEQLQPSVPADWLSTQGKGVKIAVLDSGLNTNHPAFKHFKNAIGHRYNATLPGNRLIMGGNDDVSEQKTDGADHGTPCLSIISGLQEGVFKGIAPLAEVFIIKISRKADNTPFELFQAPDFLNGLKIAKGLKVDMAVASLTYSQMKLNDFDLSKDLADQAIADFLSSGALLFSSIKNYHMLTDGVRLSAKYFPTWHAQSLNCGYVPTADVWEKLKPDPGIHFLWDKFKPFVYRASGEVEAADLSTSYATYATAGVAALALAHLKAGGQEPDRTALLQHLQQISQSLDTASTHDTLQLLQQTDGNS